MRTKTKADTKPDIISRSEETETAAAAAAFETVHNGPIDGMPEELTAIDKSYLERRIEECIDEYKTVYKTDIFSYTQIQWNHVLDYVYKHCLYQLRIDYRNIELLDIIADIYINICRMYNKSSSLYGYSIITGIDYYIFKDNRSKNRMIYYDIDKNILLDADSVIVHKIKYSCNTIIQLSNEPFIRIVKKLSSDREHSLTDKAENGSVMSLALGKIEYGWIESAKERKQLEIMEKYALPTDIMSKYGIPEDK